jgi:DnaK suppressor protein
MSKSDKKAKPTGGAKGKAQAPARGKAAATPKAPSRTAKPVAKPAGKPAAKSPAKPAVAAKPAASTKPATPAPKETPKPVAKPAAKQPDKKHVARAKISNIVLTPDYRPSEDEPFMNEYHRVYFKQKLMAWKEDIIRQTKETLEGLHEDSTQHADLADRATSETDRALELRARDRQRKLISKIDAALARIEDGTYGYCEETGEPIGLKRLDARPIATLSVEAQERHERRERVYRED